MAKLLSALPRTVEEFDRWHAERPERWEFILGVPVMMAPPSNVHSLIKTHIGRALGNKLAGTSCRTFVDGPEVKSRHLSAIPDVLVTCEPFDKRTGRVDQPKLLVEVISPSSERDDTERKWQGYCLIPSLSHYLVVGQEQAFVILHTRVGDFEWSERVFEEGTIELEAIGASLSFDEIYDGVEFEGPTDDTSD